MDIEIASDDSENKEDKIKEIINLLEQSRLHLEKTTNKKMFQFKTWMLQADLIINNVIKIDRLTLKNK